MTITDNDNDSALGKIDLSQHIYFKDDGPTANLDLNTKFVVIDGDPPKTYLVNEGEVILNDANLKAPSVLLAKDLFTDHSTAGNDLLKSKTYSLAFDPSIESGLIDSKTNQSVFFEVNQKGKLIGRIESGKKVLSIAVNEETGDIKVIQFRAIKHDVSTEKLTNQDIVSIKQTAIQLVVTLTDNDNDSARDHIDIGESIKFQDDTPHVDLCLNPQTEIRLDETTLRERVTVLGTDLFTNHSSTGQDGLSQQLFTLELDETVSSGLIDAITNQTIVLKLNDQGKVIGRNEQDDLVLTIKINKDTGDVTVKQFRAIKHDNPNDHDEALTPKYFNEGVVKLTLTMTDNDNDSAQDSIDLGPLIKFEDDGPTIDLTPKEETDNLLILDDASFQKVYLYVEIDGLSGLFFSLETHQQDTGIIDSNTGTAITIQKEDDKLIAKNAFNDVVFEVTVNNDTHEISVEQFRAIQHSNTNDPKETNTPQIVRNEAVVLSITGQDETGQSHTLSINMGQRIQFLDDGPSINSIERTTLSNMENQIIVGQLESDIGGDKAGELTFSGGNDGDTARDLQGNLLYFGEEAITLSGFDTDTLLGSTGTREIFELKLDLTNQSYHFTLKEPLDGVNDKALTFIATLKDGDGDSVTGNIEISIDNSIQATTEHIELSLFEDSLKQDVNFNREVAHINFKAGTNAMTDFVFGNTEHIQLTHNEEIQWEVKNEGHKLIGKIDDELVIRLSLNTPKLIKKGHEGQIKIRADLFRSLSHDTLLFDEKIDITDIEVLALSNNGIIETTSHITLNIMDDRPTIETTTLETPIYLSLPTTILALNANMGGDKEGTIVFSGGVDGNVLTDKNGEHVMHIAPIIVKGYGTDSLIGYAQGFEYVPGKGIFLSENHDIEVFTATLDVKTNTFQFTHHESFSIESKEDVQLSFQTIMTDGDGDMDEGTIEFSVTTFVSPSSTNAHLILNESDLDTQDAMSTAVGSVTFTAGSGPLDFFRFQTFKHVMLSNQQEIEWQNTANISKKIGYINGEKAIDISLSNVPSVIEAGETGEITVNLTLFQDLDHITNNNEELTLSGIHVIAFSGNSSVQKTAAVNITINDHTPSTLETEALINTAPSGNLDEIAALASTGDNELLMTDEITQLNIAEPNPSLLDIHNDEDIFNEPGWESLAELEESVIETDTNDTLNESASNELLDEMISDWSEGAFYEELVELSRNGTTADEDPKLDVSTLDLDMGQAHDKTDVSKYESIQPDDKKKTEEKNTETNTSDSKVQAENNQNIIEAALPPHSLANDLPELMPQQEVI